MTPPLEPKLVDDLYHCGLCGEFMNDIWENNGFEPPDPTHWEVVALRCLNRDCPQYNIEL